MINKRFSAILLFGVLVFMVMITVSACKNEDTKTNEKDISTDQADSSEELLDNSEELELTEIEAEFILVSETEGELLIYYNLNQLTSIAELEDFIDLGYDFDKSPELFVEYDDVSEETKEEIVGVLDKKNVRYTIIEDY